MGPTMNRGMMPPPPPVGGGAPPPQGPSSQMPPSVAGMFGDDGGDENAAPESATAPGFKTEAEIEERRCVGCKNWDGEGRCNKFGVAAEAMDTCDGFEMGEGGLAPPQAPGAEQMEAME